MFSNKVFNGLKDLNASFNKIIEAVNEEIIFGESTEIEGQNQPIDKSLLFDFQASSYAQHQMFFYGVKLPEFDEIKSSSIGVPIGTFNESLEIIGSSFNQGFEYIDSCSLSIQPLGLQIWLHAGELEDEFKGCDYASKAYSDLSWFDDSGLRKFWLYDIFSMLWIAEASNMYLRLLEDQGFLSKWGFNEEVMEDLSSVESFKSGFLNALTVDKLFNASLNGGRQSLSFNEPLSQFLRAADFQDMENEYLTIFEDRNLLNISGEGGVKAFIRQMIDLIEKSFLETVSKWPIYMRDVISFYKDLKIELNKLR